MAPPRALRLLRQQKIFFEPWRERAGGCFLGERLVGLDLGGRASRRLVKQVLQTVEDAGRSGGSGIHAHEDVETLSDRAQHTDAEAPGARGNAVVAFARDKDRLGA